MQLDKTRIAVRERLLFELMDLALQLCRVYARPLFACLLLGAAPCAVINYLLIGWMGSPDYIEYAATWLPWRYAWTTMLLTVIEVPLATAFISAFLGKAVFEERPTIRQVIRDVAGRAPQLALCLGCFRGTFVAWGTCCALEAGDDFTFAEFMLMPIALWALLTRAVRPFLNEIILLERTPIRAADPLVMTVRKRSGYLHAPATSDLIMRWIGCAWVACLLAVAVGGNLLFLKGVFLGSWRMSWSFMTFLYPFALWLVVGFMAVVRFLSYIDLRIRFEGWEVELLVRAEAERMASPTLGGEGSASR